LISARVGNVEKLELKRNSALARIAARLYREGHPKI
jgi:hypothetical protein